MRGNCTHDSLRPISADGRVLAAEGTCHPYTYLPMSANDLHSSQHAPRTHHVAGGASLLLAVASWAWAMQASPPADQRAPPTAVPAYRQANKVAVLTVHGAIDGITLRSLERRVRQARDDGADAIVFDIDTPGGALDATLDICHLIRTDAPANTRDTACSRCRPAARRHPAHRGFLTRTRRL